MLKKLAVGVMAALPVVAGADVTPGTLMREVVELRRAGGPEYDQALALLGGSIAAAYLALDECPAFSADELDRLFYSVTVLMAAAPEYADVAAPLAAVRAVRRYCAAARMRI